jgi:WD40 repeat protein
MTTSTTNTEFKEELIGTLLDYVTAVTWSPVDSTLAAVSAAGEVAIWENDELNLLQTATSESIDCAAFSPDGNFLAIGGQDGRVKIWRVRGSDSLGEYGELIANLENAPAWIDKLVWNPKGNQLAFCIKTYVQIWDADRNQVIATLNFEDSSPLGLDWSGDGKYLAVGGNKGVKIWNCQHWDEQPYFLEMSTVSTAIAWSADGKFLASGNMDRSVSVLEWGNPDPWVMRGFPGKIRHIAWSDINAPIGAPLLATCSVEGMVVWEKLAEESLGWEARVLTNHVDIIQGIAFAPGSFLLASAASDGWLCLWKKAKTVSQVITGVSNGYSCLAWHPQGKLLAAGGDNGEIIICSKVSRSQGFGKS